MSVTIRKARKKPVTIDYVVFNGKNSKEIAEWIRENGGGARAGGTYIKIDTIEGTMTARKGWYIIRGVAGEFYPCDPDIFEATYNPVKK